MASRANHEVAFWTAVPLKAPVLLVGYEETSMNSRIMEIDASLYSPDVVQATAHRFTSHCFVALARTPNGYVVELPAKPDASLADDLDRVFANELLDQALRAQVRAETRGVHEMLISAALGPMIGRTAE